MSPISISETAKDAYSNVASECLDNEIAPGRVSRTYDFGRHFLETAHFQSIRSDDEPGMHAKSMLL